MACRTRSPQSQTIGGVSCLQQHANGRRWMLVFAKEESTTRDMFKDRTTQIAPPDTAPHPLAGTGPIKGTRARDLLRERLGPNPYAKFGVEGEAHHIFGVELFDTSLGTKLHDWGIDLNSTVNGVWLPRKDYPG